MREYLHLLEITNAARNIICLLLLLFKEHYVKGFHRNYNNTYFLVQRHISIDHNIMEIVIK